MAKTLNKVCFYLFFLISILGFKPSQKQSHFVLRARIIALPDDTPVYLTFKRDTVGNAKSKDGKFEFTGTVAGGANYYFIKTSINGKTQSSKALWLENKEMTAIGDVTDLTKLKLEGSDSQNDYLEAGAIPTKKGDTTVMLFKQFVESHGNSLYVPNLILRMLHVYSENELERIYANLSSASKETYYGKQLATEVQRRLKHRNFYANGLIGNVVPDFRLTTLNGKNETLHKIISQNKITLIDFWASWCKPCRAQVPNLKKVYENFSAKGFGIIGISIDKTSSDWKKAVLEDRIPWIQGIDNVETAWKDIFKIDGIPAYLLIDSSNKIIAAQYFSNSLKINSGVIKGNLTDSLDYVISQLIR